MESPSGTETEETPNGQDAQKTVSIRHSGRYEIVYQLALKKAKKNALQTGIP